MQFGRSLALRATRTTYLLQTASLVRLSVCVHAQSYPNLPTPWTVAHQAPLSMGFSRQESRSRLPFPSPGDLPVPGIELTSPAFGALADRFFTIEPPGK